MALVPHTASQPAGSKALVLHGGAQGPGHTGDPVKDLEAKLKFIQDNVPTRIQNVSGSQAGAGSGEFHQYRMARRREQFRLERMDEEEAEAIAQREFETKQREREQRCEERTLKKRQKRLKKKAKQKKQRTGDATAGGGAAAVKEGDVGDSSDGSDEEEELAGRGDLD